MNKGQAKVAVDGIYASSRKLSVLNDMVVRSKELIDDPDVLIQGNFGICGMTSAVRSMLQHRLQSFVDLMGTLFLNAPFRGIAPPPTMWNDLLGNAAAGGVSSLDHTALDFLLARSLGVLFRVADPTSYQAQIEFSKLFNPRFADTSGTVVDVCTLDRSYIPDLTAAAAGAGVSAGLAQQLTTTEYWLQHQCGFGIDLAHAAFAETVPRAAWTISFRYDDADRVLTIGTVADDRPLNVTTQVSGLLVGEGHLGFDVDGMLTFLREVAGFTDVRDEGAWKVSARVGQVNDAIAAGGTNVVYAGINAFEEFQAAYRRRRTVFDGPPAPLVSYFGRLAARPQHWVVINGAITDAGTPATPRFRIPVWSWDRTFTIDIAKEQLDDYVFRWVLARVA